MNISKAELTCLVDNHSDFLKTFDQASKCKQIPVPKPKVEIGSTKSKDNLFAHYYNDTIEHPNRQIRLTFRFGNSNSCVSLGRSDYQCPQCGSVCQVRNIPFEDQRNSFFLSLGQGVYILKRTENQFKMLSEMSIVLSNFVSTEKIANLFVTTPRSIYACGKCGALLFVHKVPLCYKSA